MSGVQIGRHGGIFLPRLADICARSASQKIVPYNIYLGTVFLGLTLMPEAESLCKLSVKFSSLHEVSSLQTSEPLHNITTLFNSQHLRRRSFQLHSSLW